MPDDLLLIHDIIVILVCCFFMGLVCSACGLPPLIGHILAGMVLGPAGLNMISSLVQVSSIGELGVYFVLFTLGLEFEFEKLQEMWRVAVLCGSAMLIVTICSGVTVGLFLHRGFSESLFVSTCVALSSTAIVAKSITPAEAETTSGRSLIGILLIQDVYLGAIVATTSLVSTSGNITFLIGLALVAKLLMSIGLVVAIAAATTKPLGRLLTLIHGYDSSVRILALLTICFAFMALTNTLGVSNELGCFIGGVTISATLSTREATHKDGVTSQMHSVLDFFLAIFFANVGTHLYPSFLHQNAWLLLTLAVATMFLKYAVGFTVWLLIWRSSDVGSGHMISAGLCQISEFTFVLATRGTRMEIITQPVYFLLISVAGISLLLSPLVWIMARKTARFLPGIA
jgi:Kef-type K+ transport system membrane component KefB